jgi:hypothetical protein
MAYQCSFKCADIIFDIFDTERVPVGVTKNKYFITPKKAIDAELWVIENKIDKVRTNEQMEMLISKGIIGTY